VDNFWLSEGEVLITQLLSHLLFINYFWGEEWKLLLWNYNLYMNYF